MRRFPTDSLQGLGELPTTALSHYRPALVPTRLGPPAPSKELPVGTAGRSPGRGPGLAQGLFNSSAFRI